jgi:hypothetical protein
MSGTPTPRDRRAAHLASPDDDGGMLSAADGSSDGRCFAMTMLMIGPAGPDVLGDSGL